MNPPCAIVPLDPERGKGLNGKAPARLNQGYRDATLFVNRLDAVKTLLQMETNEMMPLLKRRGLLDMGYIQGEGRPQGRVFEMLLDDGIPGDHVCRVIGVSCEQSKDGQSSLRDRGGRRHRAVRQATGTELVTYSASIGTRRKADS